MLSNTVTQKQPPYTVVKCDSVVEMQAVVDFVREPKDRWTVTSTCGPFIELDRPCYIGCHSSEGFVASNHKDTKIISFKEFERDYLKAQSTGSSSTELTSLPEKWCIKITEENKGSLNAFKISKGKTSLSKGHYSFVDYQGFGLGEGYSGSYQQITSDQFKKWVLKTEDKLVLKEYAPQTKESLLEEAKRRYPVGTKFISPQNNIEYVSLGVFRQGIMNDSHVLVTREGGENEYCYLRGRWAEIIKMPTTKQNDVLVNGNAVPEYVEMIDNGQSYTTHSAVSEIGIENYDYGNVATNGEVYKVVKEEVIRTNESSYVLKSYSGKGYLVGKSGCKPSTKEAYERQENPNKSLVGRYLKCVKEDVKIYLGQFYKITEYKPTWCEKSRPVIKFEGNTSYYYLDFFELMPEGFVPPPNKTSYDWPAITQIKQQLTQKEVFDRYGVMIHRGENGLVMDCETAPLRSWEYMDRDRSKDLEKLMVKYSHKPQPSSTVSVKSHEEFKINIIKPKTIKL